MALLVLIASSTLLATGSVDPSAHRANPVYRALVAEGADVAGKRVAFSKPSLADGLSREEQQKVLVRIAGSERAVADFIRPSITAPHILRLHDDKAREGALIRGGDLWFVIQADLDAIDPAGAARKAADSRPVEAGNMRFSSKLLDASALQKRGIRISNDDGPSDDWRVHFTGRILGRIQVESTDRVTASRSPESWVIASRTDQRFDGDGDYPNRWLPLDPSGAARAESHPYAGGASYVKISRLSAVPGSLLFEVHFVFTEPRAWFDGAPILRSKISLVAQERIRSLRSELAKSRKSSEDRKETGPGRNVRESNPVEK